MDISILLKVCYSYIDVTIEGALNDVKAYFTIHLSVTFYTI